jgi:hypothetical protein
MDGPSPTNEPSMHPEKILFICSTMIYTQTDCWPIVDRLVPRRELAKVSTLRKRDLGMIDVLPKSHQHLSYYII